MQLIDTLAPGPVDIVGDVHGEAAALESLLGHLGYHDRAPHPAGRRLVFLGDLVDRGPDNVMVVDRVRQLVEVGAAHCLLGNHELNILLDDAKHGNEWFFSTRGGAALDNADRQQLRQFFASLPVALERADLRVVHACWDRESVERIRADQATVSSAAALKTRYTEVIRQSLDDENHAARYARERRRYGHLIAYGDADPFEFWPEPRMLDAHAYENETYQMGNPVRVLTSGEERKAASVFPAGGKFRFLDRIPWWNHYQDETPVVIGHYWRRYQTSGESAPGKFGPDLLQGIEPQHWMGARHNVYCVDFSVGARASARKNGQPVEHHKLAALRWPEREVVFDDGERRQTA